MRFYKVESKSLTGENILKGLKKARWYLLTLLQDFSPTYWMVTESLKEVDYLFSTGYYFMFPGTRCMASKGK